MSPILKARALLILALALASLQCNGGGTGANLPANTGNTATNAAPAIHGYEVVNTWPHDSNAFTQGLVFAEGKLFEGTGQIGSSSLRLVEPQTGKILKKVDVPAPFFGEGITFLNGKLYQLTWQHGIGFIYDAQKMEPIGRFEYPGEGWGITTDGRSLIISDGTNLLKFLDPDSFRVTKTIAVLDGSRAIQELNELEYVNGEIYANIWHDQRIVTIDPQTGRVTGWIDLTGLLPPGDVNDPEAVLNGIAYDQAQKRLFVTGKLWPRLFEIRIK